MFKRNFTLIELIVVIAVLGILAAIIVPNISSFQRDAREVQLTADLRNIQTASDMFRVKSASGVEDPTYATAYTVTATQKLAQDGTKTAGAATLSLLEMNDLYSKYLRKVPTYVKNTAMVAGDTTADKNLTVAELTTAGLDWNKGEVVAGILMNGTESTAIVQYASVVDGDITVVRQ